MTLRPKRQSVQEDGVAAASAEFQDPLKKYEPPPYEDDLERSLAEDTVAAVQTRPVMAIAPSTTIEQAMRLMVDREIACVLVTGDDRLLGIFSERDVLARVGENYASMKDRPVSEVMTPAPLAVHETDSPGKALNVMVTGGFRHVPILDVDDKAVGILGPRRVTQYLRRYFPTQ